MTGTPATASACVSRYRDRVWVDISAALPHPHVFRGARRGIRGANIRADGMPNVHRDVQVLESIYPTELTSAWRPFRSRLHRELRLMQRIIGKGNTHRCGT